MTKWINKLQWIVVEILALDVIRNDSDSLDPTLRNTVVHAFEVILLPTY